MTWAHSADFVVTLFPIAITAVCFFLLVLVVLLYSRSRAAVLSLENSSILDGWLDTSLLNLDPALLSNLEYVSAQISCETVKCIHCKKEAVNNSGVFPLLVDRKEMKFAFIHVVCMLEVLHPEYDFEGLTKATVVA